MQRQEGNVLPGITLEIIGVIGETHNTEIIT